MPKKKNVGTHIILKKKNILNLLKKFNYNKYFLPSLLSTNLLKIKEKINKGNLFGFMSKLCTIPCIYNSLRKFYYRSGQNFFLSIKHYVSVFGNMTII